MKTITSNDYVVSIGDNDEITITYKGADITANIIGKSSDIDAFIKSVTETIVKSVTRCRAEIKKRDDHIEELEDTLADAMDASLS